MPNKMVDQSGVFIGIITARSVDEPSAPELISYSIQIQDDSGVVDFEDIAPQPNDRWSSVADVELVPFEIGQRVLVGISRLGDHEMIEIHTREFPNMGPCT